jgi:hypothetical protein
LSDRIDGFLGARGFSREQTKPAAAPSIPASTPTSSTPAAPPLTFVCENDVRAALAEGRKLVVSERAIVTPSARELAEAGRVITFV